MSTEQMHGQMRRELIAEKLRPEAAKQLPALRPQVSEAVKHIEGFVIVDVQHAFSSLT